MLVEWNKDVDTALAQAKQTGRPILLDFSTAPQCSGCVRLEAESYSDQGVAAIINKNFVPVEAHIKEHPAWFKRFDVNWTPTVLILDSQGKERHRIEGYLPKEEFEAQLE